MADCDFSTLKLPIEPGGWCDADERMFHACFSILGQFVEEELGRDPTCDEDAAYRGYRLHFEGDANPRAIDLWLWYRDELPKIQEAYDHDVHECYLGTLRTEPVPGTNTVRVVDFGRVREPRFPHDYPETVKDEKLRELIELRRRLWT